MKNLNNCKTENCIPTPAGCIRWEHGDIDFLGIKDGDFLPNIIWEMVTKLQELTGDDIAGFDVDALVDLCNLKEPSNINLLSILNLLKANQICLKDYLDKLNDTLAEMSNEDRIDINLRCYANEDNLGNQMSINRQQLDQLIINELCDHEDRLTSLEGSLTNIQEQVDSLEVIRNNTGEPTITTCVDSGIKPVSSHVKSLATEFCEQRTSTGDSAAISSALAKTPPEWNQQFNSIQGWDINPDNWAEDYGNMKLAFANLLARVKYMEENCCAADCDDVKVGFSAMLNETGDGIILRFTSGAGTRIPAGFVDKGSTGTITDQNGNVESFNITISNNLEDEIFIDALNKKGELSININAKLGNGTLVCEKCLSKIVMTDGCGYCEITATGAEGASAIITYLDNTGNNVVNIPPVLEPSTTSTTTVPSVE